jgi:hypothetical protein
MIRRIILVAALVLACTLPAATPALAHDAVAITEQLQAGPYLLEVSLDRDPPRTGQNLDVTVRALPGGAPIVWNGGSRVTVVAMPAAGTDATQTRQIMLQPETHDRSSFAGTVQFPVRGSWTLEIQASGPDGEGTASLPLAVAGPPVIPFWLGWLIGLSPVLGLVWFADWNRRYLRRELSVVRHQSSAA